jgi:pimeloyl-ACP methyl ester carboxylesterase
MPALLVHGVPETASLWDGVLAHLDRSDARAVSLPGFGAPTGDRFGSTMDEYVDWLVGELEAVGEPVDLVGHDWGGGFTLRLVSVRPDLVRSWVTDAAGLADVNFEWHDFAKLWQTPGAGEDFWEQNLAAPVEDRAGQLAGAGVPEAHAGEMAARVDRTMADAILALYRSATKVHEVWGPAFDAIPKPGMVVIPTEDPFLDEGSARRAGERAGARIEVLEGVGHWWILQDPARAAATLQSFWAAVD